jgi:hypothetical protein
MEMANRMDLTPKALAQKSRANGQHPRTLIVATARAALAHAVCQIEEKYDLTAIDLVHCLADVIQGLMKYALRVERHGDAEYPAEAPPAPRRRARKAVSA